MDWNPEMVHEHVLFPGVWEVTWADDDSGAEHVVLFGGYEPQQLALEYVALKKGS